MNVNARARHFIGHQLAAIVALSALFVTGCPQEPASDEDMSGMNAENNASSSDMGWRCIHARIALIVPTYRCVRV